MALELDWGADDKVVSVTASDFMKDSKKMFGFDYDAAEMLPLRELFKHASKVYVYKVTSGGVKASNTFAEAKYTGKKGNDLKVVIQTNVDDGERFDVLLYLGTEKMDSQTVSKASELIDNDFVMWKKSAELSVTAATALSGGTNGTASTSNHQAFLDKMLQYYDKLSEGENGKEKVESLLQLYNRKSKSFQITNAIGDVSVRAGCLLPVILDLGVAKVQSMMLVESCKHVFRENENFMNLTLKQMVKCLQDLKDADRQSRLYLIKQW